MTRWPLAKRGIRHEDMATRRDQFGGTPRRDATPGRAVSRIRETLIPVVGTPKNPCAAWARSWCLAAGLQHNGIVVAP